MRRGTGILDDQSKRDDFGGFRETQDSFVPDGGGGGEQVPTFSSGKARLKAKPLDELSLSDVFLCHERIHADWGGKDEFGLSGFNGSEKIDAKGAPERVAEFGKAGDVGGMKEPLCGGRDIKQKDGVATDGSVVDGK